MKKTTIFLILILTTISIFSQNQKVELDLLNDSLITASAITLNLPKLILSQDTSNLDTDKSNINTLDSLTSFTYNKEIDDISTYLSYALLISPGILFFNDDTKGDIFTIGIIYLETFLIATGVKDTLKTFMPKYRPYMYNGSTPEEDSDEYSASFPSGHTTLAFMSAGFLTSISNIYDLNSSFKIPLIATSFALATTVGVMRVASGAHFTTDVLVGALLGSTIGYIVPLLHKTDSNTDLHLSFNGNLGILLSHSI